MNARPIACVLLLIHAALLMWSGYCHSPGTDEPAHLTAGLAIWQKGRFDLYRVNPPLIKIIAAAPVAAAQPVTDWSHWNQQPGARSGWRVGRDFLAGNSDHVQWYFALARWACIPVSLLGGYVCFRWASDLFGSRAGLLACGLWCFSPNILGNAAMITPDVGAAAFGGLAGYRFWRWQQDTTTTTAVLAGLALGTALLAKTTWIILLLLWPAMWSISLVTGRNSAGSWRREGAHVALMLLLGLYVLNLGYEFHGSFRPLGDYTFFSKSLAGPANFSSSRTNGGNRFQQTPLAYVPVPFPQAFLEGIDLQKHDFELGKWCFLDGRHQYGGWWYFYLYALMIKVPLGTWLLGLLAVTIRISQPNRFRLREETALLLPILTILFLLSTQTGFTIYLRYALPVFPFAFVWMSSSAFAFAGTAAVCIRYLTIGAIVWSFNSSLFYVPHSLAYFNELAGGPREGHNVLLDGNVDWGQDLYFLRQWRKDHPDARPTYVAVYGQMNPAQCGVAMEVPARAPRELTEQDIAALRKRLAAEADAPSPADRQPTSTSTWLKPGWYAVSVNVLHGYRTRIWSGGYERVATNPHWFTYFRALDPVDSAGYSILIYHITEEEAAVIRSAYGLDDDDAAVADSDFAGSGVSGPGA